MDNGLRGWGGGAAEDERNPKLLSRARQEKIEGGGQKSHLEKVWTAALSSRELSVGKRGFGRGKGCREAAIGNRHARKWA